MNAFDSEGAAPVTIEEMREEARREGVGCEENLPFLFEPATPSEKGILLVHGFTASPWEMRSFGSSFAEAGFVTLGVRIPGHGTTPEDLKKRSCEDWLEGTERGYRLLCQRAERVYGMGMSTGGLLLLDLASRRSLDGLVLLSPYLRLRHSLAPAAGWLRFLKGYHRPPRPAPYYYDRRPLHGIHQINRLIRRVRAVLGAVEAPTLAVSGCGDLTVRIESAMELYLKLASRRKEFHLYGPEVPHVLTTAENPRRAEALSLTLSFLLGLEEEREERKSFRPPTSSTRGSRNCR